MNEKVIHIELSADQDLLLRTYNLPEKELQFIIANPQSQNLSGLFNASIYSLINTLLNTQTWSELYSRYHELIFDTIYLSCKVQIIKKSDNSFIIQLEQIQILQAGVDISHIFQAKPTHWQNKKESRNPGLMISNPKGLIEYANFEIQKILGEAPTSLYNQSIFKLFQIDQIQDLIHTKDLAKEPQIISHILGIFRNNKACLLHFIICKKRILIYVSELRIIGGEPVNPSYLYLLSNQKSSTKEIEFTTDEKDYIIDISPNINEITQFQYWEVIGLPASRFYADPKVYSKVLNILNHHGSIQNHYVDFLGSEGEVITAILGSQITEKSPDGKWVGTHGKLQFIDRSNKRKNTLGAQRELLRSVVYTFPNPVCVFSSERQVVVTNPKFLELVGLESHQVIGKPASSVEILESILNSYPNLLSTESSVYHQCKDALGFTRIFELLSSVFYHPTHNEKWVLLTFNDQTQEQLYRNEIKNKATYQNLIISIASDMVNIPDSDIHKASSKAIKSISTYLKMDMGLLLAVDSQDEDILEVKSEWHCPELELKNRVLKKKIKRIHCDHTLQLNKANQYQVHEFQTEELESGLIQEYLLNHNIKRVIITHLNHQGSNIGYLLWGTSNEKYECNEDVCNVVKLFANIVTNAVIRSRFEQDLLKATQIAQSANRAKTDFLANMTHEIRTPMNGILGISELLSHTNLTQEQKDFIHIIQSSGEALMNIVNDVMDLSKIEARSLDLNESEFDLIQNIENVLELLAPKANTTEKQIELCYLIDSDVPVSVIGDSGRFQQILINLINNAIKFTHKGFVKLHISVVKKGAKSWIINGKVEDTGIGIKRKKIKELFKPFNQLESTITSQYGGTGLGLTITKELVEKMNGDISVDSNFGKGSTFSFNIEFKRSPHKNQTFGDKESSKKLHIMVIDDNPVNLLLIERILHSLGYQVTCVSSAQTAISQLNEMLVVPNALIIDHAMNDIDGIELSLYLSEIERYKNVPKILLSSLTRFADKDLINQAGIRKHLRKPIRKSIISEVLHQILFSSSHNHSQSLPEFKRLNKHILLVEDNSVNQLVISSMLTKIGFNTTIAEDGEEAIQLLSKLDIDLVLMDCRLPVMNGFDATKEIRLGKAGNHNRDILIIGLSASALTEDREACLQAGMNDYLSKPVRMNQLEQTILQNFPQEKEPAQIIPDNSIQHLHFSNDSPLETDIDFSEVEELADGDVTFLYELKKTFKETTLEDIKTLKQAILELDYKTMVALAHKIVAPCRHFGLHNIAKNLKQVENTLLKVESKSERHELVMLIQKTILHLESLVSQLTIDEIKI